jgi:hypothetical protein
MPDTTFQLRKKACLLSDLKETRQKILAQMSSLTDEQQDQVFLGIWSVKDLLAHITGWDDTNLAAVNSVQAGQVPVFYEHRDRVRSRGYKVPIQRLLEAELKDEQTHLQQIPDFFLG